MLSLFSILVADQAVNGKRKPVKRAQAPKIKYRTSFIEEWDKRNGKNKR